MSKKNVNFVVINKINLKIKSYDEEIFYIRSNFNICCIGYDGAIDKEICLIGAFYKYKM